MSNVVIVAIPRQDDYVWKISSEKKPHMTLCFLGDSAPLLPIFEFVSHAVETMRFGPFGLDVDFRGVLGPDEADVLFFRKDWSIKKIAEFRTQLLKDNTIRKAYESVTQYPMWTPHLTLGYPETPANEDNRDYPGIQWVEFDKIAVWDGDFEGPEIQLEHNFDDAMEVSMSVQAGEEFIRHYGVKGMKWGQRKDRGGEMGKRKGIQKFIDPQGHKLRSDVIKSVAGTVFLPIAPLTIAADIRLYRGAGRGAKALVKKKEQDRFAKKAMSPKNFVKIHNGAVPEMNRISAQLASKYPDLSKPGAKAAYDAAYLAAMRNAYQKSANTIGNRSGTHHLDVQFKSDVDFVIRARGGPPKKKHTAAHADVPDEEIITEIPGKFVRDADGYIVKVTFGASHDVMSLGEAFIMHHGVKGMKWGVRKNRTAPAARATTATSHVSRNRLAKTRVKAGGGQNHPATDDAIKAALVKQKLRKSGHAALSNAELQELATRLNLEVQVQQLIAKAPKTPVEAVKAQVKKDPIGSAKTTVRVGKDAHKFVQKTRAKRR